MKKAILLILLVSASAIVGASGMYFLSDRRAGELVSGSSVRGESGGAALRLTEVSAVRTSSSQEELSSAINKLVESQLAQSEKIAQILDRLGRLENDTVSRDRDSPSREYISEEELAAQAEAQVLAAQSAFYDEELDMATQPLDSPWAAAMRHALQQAQTSTAGDVGIKVVDSECRSRTCRVEFGVQGAVAVNPEILIPLVISLPQADMKMMKVDGEGEPRYVALFHKTEEQ
mgnify:CR=1 FL=1|jgi:hypothetical protein